jgi:hypothetical protein
MSEHKYTIKEHSQIMGAVRWLMDIAERGLPGGPVAVSVGRERRSLDQNSKLWPMLTDISKQVEWYGRHPPQTWKDLVTGTFRKGKVLPNLDGDGFVVTGLSTSKMTKPEFSELIEYIYSYGADQGVQWSEPSLSVFAEYREVEQH